MIDDENLTAGLVRLAGPRPAVPPDRAARVRAAVHTEWQVGVRRRTVRRRVAMLVVLLGAAGAIWGATQIARRSPATEPPVVARIERVDGALERAASITLRAGEWLDTSTARIALRLLDGTSMRLDAGCRVRLLSPSIVELAHGGVYVDTGGESGGLEVRTAFGTVRDLGTQFETRVTGGTLVVRVRAGSVRLQRPGGGDTTAAAGTELTLNGGDLTSRPLAGYASEWSWASALAPPFEIEGRTLAAFVEHLSREQGWSVRYTDAVLAGEAANIILHGSVSGLPPEDALAVALASGDLTHRVQNGELLITRVGRGW